MGGGLVLVFDWVITAAGQDADTQLSACTQLVLVEVSESLKKPYQGSF
ncbi:MAG: hypothetical protein M0R41_01310 [Methylobacter tundripaludum]|nr:hypothetical protein [Methylobacter tundripaludum]